MDKNTTRTELNDLGEFKLIELLTKEIQMRNPSTIQGVGDDAAVIDPLGQQLVVTTDYLLEGVHFDLIYHPLKHLGYKAVMVNLSDVYAMNAQPTQVTVSLGVSKRFSVEDLQELYSGMLLACQQHGVDLVGGDTTASLTGLVLSITAIGLVNKNEVVYRRGAQVGDLICVSGDLGSAYMGLLLLEREKKVFDANPESQPQLQGFDYLLERYLKPEARGQVIHMLQTAAVLPSAMIDISDGLSSELFHLCSQSNVGCRVYLERIPLDAMTEKLASEMNLDPVVAALNGGEDYELLFTVPLAKHDVIKGMEGISIIGHVMEQSEGVKLVLPHGDELDLLTQGWRSF